MLEFRRDPTYAWRINCWIIQDTPYVKVGYLNKEYGDKYQFVSENITVIFADELKQIANKLDELNETV